MQNLTITVPLDVMLEQSVRLVRELTAENEALKQQVVKLTTPASVPVPAPVAPEKA